MKKVSGTFNGTGAGLYLCFGFIPDYIRIIALEEGNLDSIEWYRDMRALEVARGIAYIGNSDALEIRAQTVADTGIEPYWGGDILTSALQTSVTYGEGVYLGWDGVDYKDDTSRGVVSAINTWNSDGSAVYTGYFNADVLNALSGVAGSGTGTGRIGEGSKVTIREKHTGKVKQTWLHAAGNGGQDAGGATTEVTLDEIVASGSVLFLGGAFDMAPIPVGQTTPAGVLLEPTATVNVNDILHMFVAEQYD